MIKNKMTEKLILYMLLVKRLLTRKQTKKTKQNQKHLKTVTSTRDLADFHWRAFVRLAQ